MSTQLFAPDLIVEATSVCDRNCNGCYAPNVISRAGAKELLTSSPKLFLSPERFEQCLTTLSSDESASLTSLAFRGGEPSRNPFLPGLIQVAAQWSQSIFIETHGRWITDPIPGEEMENRRLIETIRAARAIVKISFDRMHGFSPEKLQAITEALDREEIQWCIAITEISEDEFARSRGLCAWIPGNKIISQVKASSLSALIRPRLGVIRPDGSIAGRVSVRDSFLPDATAYPSSSRRPA